MSSLIPIDQYLESVLDNDGNVVTSHTIDNWEEYVDTYLLTRTRGFYNVKILTTAERKDYKFNEQYDLLMKAEDILEGENGVSANIWLLQQKFPRLKSGESHNWAIIHCKTNEDCMKVVCSLLYPLPDEEKYDISNPVILRSQLYSYRIIPDLKLLDRIVTEISPYYILKKRHNIPLEQIEEYIPFDDLARLLTFVRFDDDFYEKCISRLYSKYITMRINN